MYLTQILQERIDKIQIIIGMKYRNYSEKAAGKVNSAPPFYYNFSPIIHNSKVQDFLLKVELAAHLKTMTKSLALL